MSDPRVSAMGERTEQDRQAAGATINARIDALADRRLSADLPRPQLVNDGHAWIAPMVWEARRAVPGPWQWLSAEPVEHQAAA